MAIPFPFSELEEINSYSDIVRAIEVIAEEINEFYDGQEYITLSLLTGAMVFSGHLLPKLNGAVLIDYLHASRYDNGYKGGDNIRVLAEPISKFKDKNVLILDDIFDQGRTLAWTKEYCLNKGAASVKTAVLASKDLVDDRERKKIESPDFHALNVPDAYVVGFGMDAESYYRNLPGIYKLK